MLSCMVSWCNAVGLGISLAAVKANLKSLEDKGFTPDQVV